MKFYAHNFIGNNEADVILPFSGMDSADSLNTSLRKMPTDWYYRKNQIVYKYNSLGHRSVEIDQLTDDYILVAGCSYTEGVGVELERSYPYLLANKFGCSYYNLGVGGSGIDILMHNLLVWISIVPKKPKVVIIQWPESTRCALIEEQSSLLFPAGIWNTDPVAQEFMLAGDRLHFFNTRKILAEKLIQTVIPGKLINFLINGKINSESTISAIPHDVARDCSHPGIGSNIKFAEKLYKAITI